MMNSPHLSGYNLFNLFIKIGPSGLGRDGLGGCRAGGSV